MAHQRQRILKKCFSLLLCSLFSSVGIAKNMEANTIQYKQIIDLSHSIHASIPLWPGDPAVKFKTVATMAKDGYYLRQFSIGEHSATHMNAPNSFISGGEGIDSYPASSLIHKAIVINVTRKTSHNADYIVTMKDIKSWEAQYGVIPADSLVFFDTGWGKRWNHPQEFINQDKQGVLHFPGIDGDVTKFLLEKRHVAGMGIDTHGLDPSQDENYRTNTQLAKQHKIALECVANLDQMPAKGATVIIGLPQLKNGSGSPVAITALVP